MYQAITFHRVTPDHDGVFDGIDPSELRAKLSLLKKVYRVKPVSDVLDRRVRWSKPTLRPSICLTLDDGYADNYRHGFPVFKDLDLKPTIFLSTGPLETGEPLWHDKVFTAFARTRVRNWGFRGQEFPLDTPQRRGIASESFAAYVRRLPEKDRDGAVEALCKELGVLPEEAVDRTPMLTWDQVAEMAEWGIEIGAHTVTHPILSTLPPERQEEEIRGSIETIEKRLGLRPRVFAYPNGKSEDFNEHTEAILARLGVEAAFTTVLGVNKSDTPRYRLYRGGGWSDNAFVFVLQLLSCRFRA